MAKADYHNYSLNHKAKHMLNKAKIYSIKFAKIQYPNTVRMLKQTMKTE